MALQSYAQTNMQCTRNAPQLTREAAIARLQRSIARVEAAGFKATVYRAQLAKIEEAR